MRAHGLRLQTCERRIRVCKLASAGSALAQLRAQGPRLQACERLYAHLQARSSLFECSSFFACVLHLSASSAYYSACCSACYASTCYAEARFQILGGAFQVRYLQGFSTAVEKSFSIVCFVCIILYPYFHLNFHLKFSSQFSCLIRTMVFFSFRELYFRCGTFHARQIALSEKRRAREQVVQF